MDEAAAIKRFNEAAAREQRLRLVAFCGVEYPLEILGEPVRLLSLRDTVALQLADNPFYCGGKIDAIAALQVFYLVSRAKTKGESAERFSRRIARRFDTAEIVGAVADYVDDMFADSGCLESGNGALNGARKPPHYANASIYVDDLATAYGWSESEILALPMARIYQYEHQIRERLNPKYTWRQLSDIAADAVVKARIEARRKG